MWRTQLAGIFVSTVAVLASSCSTHMLSRSQNAKLKEVQTLVKAQNQRLDSATKESGLPGAVLTNDNVYPGTDYVDAIDRREAGSGNIDPSLAALIGDNDYIVFAYRDSIPREPDIISAAQARSAMQQRLDLRRQLRELDGRIEDARSVVIDGMKLGFVTQLQLSEQSQQVNGLQSTMSKLVSDLGSLTNSSSGANQAIAADLARLQETLSQIQQKLQSF